MNMQENRLSEEDYSKDLGESRSLWGQQKTLLFWLVQVTFFTSLMFMFGINHAQAKEVTPVAGVDYKVIPDAVGLSGNKVEVDEFFSYACPHCYHFLPLVEPWAKKQPNYVAFKHIPVGMGNPTWSFVQKVYISLDEMGLEPALHENYFASIHRDHLEIYHDRDALNSWLNKNHVNVSQFNSIFDSFSTATKANADNNLAMKEGVDQVPLLIIDGKYIVAPGDLRDRTFPVAEYLIGLEAKRLGLKK